MTRPETRVEIRQQKFYLGVTVIALIVAFLMLLRPFLMPVILATLIAAFSYPVYAVLLRALRGWRHPAALVMTLLLLFIIVLPVTVFANWLVDHVYALVQTLNFRELFANLFTSSVYLDFIEPRLARLEGLWGVKINVLDYLTQFAKERAVALSQFSPKVVMGTASYLFDFIVMIVTVHFLYVEGPRLYDFLLDLSPLRANHETELVEQFKSTVRATLVGMALTALVQAILATIGFYISGVPVAGILGVATFFMALIPFVGTTGVWLPVAIWFFVRGETGWGVFHLVYGVVVVSGIDNVIKPLLIRGRTNSHPLLIFFSLIGGLWWLGPLGILIGPVITASLIATSSIYLQETRRLER